jgi:hypothetical protein
MFKRLLQLMLIMLAVVWGYQLPNLDISFPLALLAIAGYGLIGWVLLKFFDGQNRS